MWDPSAPSQYPFGGGDIEGDPSFARRSAGAEDELKCQSSRLGEIVLPIHIEVGIECIAMNSSDRWLHQALSGTGANQMEIRDQVGEFVDEVMRVLRNADGSETEVEHGIVDEAKEQRGESCSPKGREALGIEEDSDEEALQDASQGSGKTVAQKRKTAVKKTAERNSFRTFIFHDIQVTARRRPRGKGFVVPVDENFPKLLTHIQSRIGSGSNGDT